jgi:hypothetical protein
MMALAAGAFFWMRGNNGELLRLPDDSAEDGKEASGEDETDGARQVWTSGSFL